MSIAVLSQVYTEARRLAVAGSVVARGDFRLKKLLPPLQEAGKAAPVFAKIAEVGTKVVDGPEASSAEALLELTSLVNAVLYTQGETGLAGKLEKVETVDLGATGAQTSARVLKPLLEALTTTGSGRLELVEDAVKRGLFRDLRLVKPAVNALDDPYPDIAELIADKVLPLYGKAIYPELRAKYDAKGAKGHPRRLKLLHAIDPAGTRELVKAALDGGSKEVKVAAISCLGSDPEDLNFLIDQAAAKTQDVRTAAYEALAKLDAPPVAAVLAKGLAGKDYEIAANAIDYSKQPTYVGLLVAEIRAGVDALPKAKTKKAVSEQVMRITHFLRSFPEGEHAEADALLLDLFQRRKELAKIKGEHWSGDDIGEAVVSTMSDGSKVVRKALVDARDELTGEEMEQAFDAGRWCLTPAQLYATFSSYLTAKVDEKKKAKDPAWVRREAVIEAIDSHYAFYYWDDDEDEDDDEEDESEPPPYDPRWLDLALKLNHEGLIRTLARPDHPGALAFAKTAFDEAIKKAKSPDAVRDELILLMRLRHPAATDAFFAALAKRGKKGTFYHYWFVNLVPRLPKEALPRLEEYVATVPENEMDQWLEAIQELRTKK